MARLCNVTLTPFLPMAEGKAWQKEEVTLIKHVSDFYAGLFWFG